MTILLRKSTRDSIHFIFTIDLRTKTIKEFENTKNPLEIEIFFGLGRVHFPFPFTFSEGEGEGEGEASVKKSDFRDFSVFWNFFWAI